MSLIALIVLLIIVGVLMNYIPMDARMKQIIVVVVVIVLCLVVLQAFGLLAGLGSIRIGG